MILGLINNFVDISNNILRRFKILWRHSLKLTSFPVSVKNNANVIARKYFATSGGLQATKLCCDFNFEQSVAIKFCVKLGNKLIETKNLLEKASGWKKTVSRALSYKWQKSFNEGRKNIHEKSVRPTLHCTNANIDFVKQTIDRGMTIREVCEETEMSFGTVQTNLN